VLPTRLVVLEPPSTPHRLDAYAVIKKQELEALSPLSRREDVVREFGKEVSKQLNVSEGTVKKITTFESPEKWIVENDQFSHSMEDIRGFMRPHLAATALRILLDAFLHKLGYRPVAWTAEETEEWKAKQKDANSIRGKVVKDSEHLLLEKGFTKDEVRALFAASLKAELNNAAHTMKLRLAVSVLHDMKVKAGYQRAVDKAFEFVCGMQMSDVNQRSNKVLTSTGLQSSDDLMEDWMFEANDEVGRWD
jgi:hypothetical protein